MIEVENIQAINKNYLLASCDVHIIPWKLTLRGIKIFEKAGGRWITLPAKEIIKDNVEKSYEEMITFDNDGVKNRFRNQIMDAIDKYLANNPEMKPESVIKENDDLPF